MIAYQSLTKFPICSCQSIWLPSGLHILAIGDTTGTVTLWALVDSTKNTSEIHQTAKSHSYLYSYQANSAGVNCLSIYMFPQCENTNSHISIATGGDDQAVCTEFLTISACGTSVSRYGGCVWAAAGSAVNGITWLPPLHAAEADSEGESLRLSSVSQDQRLCIWHMSPTGSHAPTFASGTVVTVSDISDLTAQTPEEGTDGPTRLLVTGDGCQIFSV
jgi:hypothetical protein